MSIYVETTGGIHGTEGMNLLGINDSVNEQLFFFTFGISIKDSDENKKRKCVEKAYLDFCRTIAYKKGNSQQKRTIIKIKHTALF